MISPGSRARCPGRCGEDSVSSVAFETAVRRVAARVSTDSNDKPRVRPGVGLALVVCHQAQCYEFTIDLSAVRNYVEFEELDKQARIFSNITG